MKSLCRAKTIYYEELGRRADEAMRAKVRDGQPSGRVPLGYARNSSGDLTVDVRKAPCIIEAFELVARGSSLRQPWPTSRAWV